MVKNYCDDLGTYHLCIWKYLQFVFFPFQNSYYNL